MKTYNVKEIAELLNTNQETVRRWIRAGMAATNPIIGISSVIGALSMGALASILGANKKKPNTTITRSDIENFLKKEISNRK